MKSILRSIIISLALLGISPIQAAPIAFIETTDFGTTNSGTTFLGTFDIGVNTVSGSILALAGADRVGSDYGDFWDAQLSPGQQITGIDIILSDITGGMRAFAGDNIVGCCADSAYTARAFTQQSTNGTFALSTDGSFTTGAYPFGAGHYYFGALVPGVNFSEFSYEWQVSVASTVNVVPVPAAVWLFGTALIGFVGLSRRRKVA